MTGVNRNTAMGFAAVLLWSTSVALARSIAEKIGPFTSGAAVYLSAGLLLFLGSYCAKKSVKKTHPASNLYRLGCGALFVIYTVSFYLALGISESRLQTLEVGMVNYLWPILSILLALPLLSKKAKPLLIPATLVALVGIFLILAQGEKISIATFTAHIMGNPYAYGFAGVAALSWALYSNLVHRWTDEHQAGAVPQFILATGLVLLILCFLFPEQVTFSKRVVLEVLGLALMTAGGYVFWDRAMRTGNVVLVMAFSYLTPFFSTVVTCLYLGVVPGITLWVGVLLVTLGSFFSWRSIDT